MEAAGHVVSGVDLMSKAESCCTVAAVAIELLFLSCCSGALWVGAGMMAFIGKYV